MSTVMIYAIVCYFYLILVWGILGLIFSSERPSLTILLGVPLIGLVAIWFLGGPGLLGTIVRYPIVFLSKVI